MYPSAARLNVRNSIDDIARAASWLDRLAASSGLPPDVTSRLHVALDEVLSNIMRHGLCGAASGTREIGLSLCRRDDTVELAIEDDGTEFNPTLLPPGRAPARGDDRIGGVGLLFVSHLTDEMDFVRNKGRNRLTLRLRLSNGKG